MIDNKTYLYLQGLMFVSPSDPYLAYRVAAAAAAAVVAAAVVAGPFVVVVAAAGETADAARVVGGPVSSVEAFL